MQLESDNVFTYKTNTENEVLQSVGSSLVGEDNNEVQTLSDKGSQGSFITHKLAKRAKSERLRITNLTMKTSPGEHTEKTFVYAVKIWDFIKKDHRIIECVGIHAIGRTRIMSDRMKMVLKKILHPYNMEPGGHYQSQISGN